MKRVGKYVIVLYKIGCNFIFCFLWVKYEIIISIVNFVKIRNSVNNDKIMIVKML